LGKERETGRPVFYDPSRFESIIEKTLVHGENSWINRVAFNIAAQSFFAENRTWIIIDPMYSYMGNAEPSDSAVDPMPSRGIPADQMDVLAPEFHLRLANADEIVHDNITGSYAAPLRFLGARTLLEMLKVNQKSSYSSTIDFMIQELVSQHQSVSMDDLINAIEHMMMDDKFPSQLVWVYNMVIMKIREVGRFVIRESAWSPVGESLHKAISENRPRWIVINAGMAMDSITTSTVSTILGEIHKFMMMLRVNKIGMNVGVLINNVDLFFREQSSSIDAVHDLIYAWGRSNGILSIVTTSNMRGMPATFVKDLDSINGTFQNVIRCFPSGIASLVDKLHGEPDVIFGPNPRTVKAFEIAEPPMKVAQPHGSTSLETRSQSIATALDRP
jgi:hypothetical protein